MVTVRMFSSVVANTNPKAVLLVYTVGAAVPVAELFMTLLPRLRTPFVQTNYRI
jgi:hypothetical protein